jgi:hypothetical protein
MAGCGGPVADGTDDLDVIDAPLAAASAWKWPASPSGETIINVCWLDAIAPKDKTTAKRRIWVKNAAKKWEVKAKVHFEGWGDFNRAMSKPTKTAVSATQVAKRNKNEASGRPRNQPARSKKRFSTTVVTIKATSGHGQRIIIQIAGAMNGSIKTPLSDCVSPGTRFLGTIAAGTTTPGRAASRNEQVAPDSPRNTSADAR